MPDIKIQLDGFADERGDEDYNLKLSGKRVEFVREQFVAAGVHPDRINVSAHGESAAQDATVDSFALERRVSVKLFISDAPSLAANPD
jgi:outer membrane protein OmpA-like peptidoglycan-associated protein